MAAEEYEFTDRSVARPFFTRAFFAPLFRLVPAWLTANFITLLGFTAALGMLALALAGHRLDAGPRALASLLALAAYAVADHLDGMQALASGTASRLGEFVDHFLDGVSGAFMVFAGLALMPGVPAAVCVSVLWLYLLAFIATYQERADDRRLHFARVGALEGIVIFGVFLLTSVFRAGRDFWNAPLVGALPGYWLVLAVAYAVFAGTVATVLARMGRVPAAFLAHALASACLGALAVAASAEGAMGHRLGWALLTAHGMAYLARVMQPDLFRGRAAPFVESALLAGAAAALLTLPLPWAWVRGGAAVLAAWTGVRAVLATRVVLKAYGDEWVWVNPDGQGVSAPPAAAE